MGTVPRPSTQKEMVEQLWFAVIGSNGDGLASITKQTRIDVAELRLTLAASTEHINELRTRQEEMITAEDLHVHMNDRDEKKGGAKRDWLLIAATGLPVVAMFLYDILKGAHG